MAQPTAANRSATMNRDGWRCVACLAESGLQFQHRVAVGNGGTKHLPTLAEGVCLCWLCNQEAEGSLIRKMLGRGIKLPQRHSIQRNHELALAIPVLYVDGWHLLNDEGQRLGISENEARERFGLWMPTKSFAGTGT